MSEKPFSRKKFFISYLGRLGLFALVIYVNSLIGLLIFIFLAAYHFGETDLYRFKTQTGRGRVLVISYGLLILNVILVTHIREVLPIIVMFSPGPDIIDSIGWIADNGRMILTVNGLLFCSSGFIYFLRHPPGGQGESGYFLVRFACLLFILFNLPLLLGFTFYFVLWHSVLSIENIFSYIRMNAQVSYQKIIRQIIFYSVLALSGIGIFVIAGTFFMNKNSFAGSIFLGLAVLTAPHLEVMYKMYLGIRQKERQITGQV